MRPRLLFPLAVLSLLVARTPLGGQTIRGDVVTGSTGDPVGEAVLVVLDEQGQARQRVPADASGRFEVRLPGPGTYRLRVDRIGYLSTTSEPITVAAAETVERRIALPTQAVTLEGLTVQAAPRCRRRPQGDAATVWEEARKALDAVALAGERRQFLVEVRSFVRWRSPGLRTVEKEESSTSRGRAANPYAALPAEELERDGYVRTTPEEIRYFAPDARVLLSDPFLDGHCFSVQRGEGGRRGQVGLAFEPVPGRRLPDVRGVLWLDARTATLRTLEFRYTGLPAEATRAGAGGEVEFGRVPGGGWIVRRWLIRMPEMTVREEVGQLGARRNLDVTRIREEGGEVTSVRAPGGALVLAAEGAGLRGEVFDSLAAGPLAGARVHLVGTPYTATTDAQGRFALDAAPEGSYRVGLSHPRLDSLGIALPPRPVTLKRGEATGVALAVPSTTTLLATLCPGASGGVVTGRVVGAGGGPAPGARVALAWTAPDVSRAGAIGVSGVDAAAVADGEGRFRVCGVLPGAVVTARAEAGALRGGPHRFVVPGGPATLTALPPLTLSPPQVAAASGGVSLRGRLVRAGSGEGIAGATVRLASPAQARVTDAEGRFRFEGLSGDTATLRVEGPGGVAAGRYVVRLDTAGAEQEVVLQLVAGAVALAPLEVRARSLSRADRDRRASGVGRNLMVRADLETLPRTSQAAGILRRVPTLTVREIWPLGSAPGQATAPTVCIESGRRALTLRSGAASCAMVEVYVDGVRQVPERIGVYLQNLPVEQIESIEFIPPVRAGARYGTGAANGVVEIYTRGMGPYAEKERDT